MGKKLAMSALGYAIILVIILGVVMIISAPMMADKFKNKEHNNLQESISDNSRRNPERDEVYDSSSSRPVKDYRGGGSESFYDEMRNIERRMNSRIDNLEMRQRDIQNYQNNKTSVSNKYVCTIEGTLDASNNVVPLDGQNSSDIKSQKLVFVCEYRE